ELIMAKTHSKLGTPFAGSFFSAFSYLSPLSTLLPVVWPLLLCAVLRFYSLISNYLCGFLETMDAFVCFLSSPYYFNCEKF
ncbi:MAG: hypothetical protein QM500_06540, partial [Methylococcales bacterium]